MIYLEILLKTILVFILILLIIRILGKRELGELSIFDLVVLLLIANIGALGIEDEEKFFPSLLALVGILVLQKVFSYMLLRVSFLRAVFDGSPAIIVENGKLNIKVMKKELYTVDDLITQMRVNRIMDLNEIKLAILETSGDLSVFTYKNYPEVILPVIASGKICKNMLPYLNLTQEQVKIMVEEKGQDIKAIYYASSDGKDLFIGKVM